MKLKRRKSKLQKKYIIRRILFVCAVLIIVISPIILFLNISEASQKKINDSRMTVKNNLGVTIYDDEIEKIYNDMSVITPKYEWVDKLEDGNVPSKIFIHHSAKDMSVEDVHRMHIENGWAGIGYHYYISKDGKIYKGRDENIIGAHIKEKNENTIGICLEGNFEEEYLLGKQESSLLELMTYIKLKYEITDVLGHRDEGETMCPGENIKISGIENKLEKIIEEKYRIKEVK